MKNSKFDEEQFVKVMTALTVLVDNYAISVSANKETKEKVINLFIDSLKFLQNRDSFKK